MNPKLRILTTLAKYFDENGEMTLTEYCTKPNIPVMPQIVRRHFASWSMMELALARYRRPVEKDI